MTLRLAEAFELPDDAATRRLAIVAMSGAGKSNAAVRLAEEMHREGIPWVAVDPKGDWWGVRSNAAGDAPGLPVPVFGGLHGDLPLDPRSGKLVAEVVATQRLTCVLDVSEFATRQEMWGFLADFGEELYRRNRAPLHLFLDEADEYIPQTARDKGNLPRCLGIWDRVVRRGRFRGIGATLITQRSATLNKDVLYMAECLIALRTGGPRNRGDRQTIAGWFDANTALGDAGRIIDALPTLGDGEAFVSSPSWLRLEDPPRVQLYRRETYDSGKTPGVGEDVQPPATLADIDLEALRGRMAAAVEQAEANDPKRLKARVTELERALAAKPSATVACDHEAELYEMRVQLERLEAANRALAIATAEAQRWRDVARRIGSQASGMAEEIEIALSGPVPEEYMAAARSLEVKHEQPRARAAVERVTPRAPTPLRDAAEGLGKAERAVLTVLAQHGALELGPLAMLARYRISGGFRNTLSALRTSGFIDGANTGTMQITDAGLQALGEYNELPTGRALLDYWLTDSRLSAAARKVLGVTYERFPEVLDVQSAAEATGYQPSGGFRNGLSELRTAGLIDGPNSGFRASALFFERSVA